MKQTISILTTMLLLCFPAHSQDKGLADSRTEQKSKQIEIYFDLNSYVVDPDYRDNRKNLSDLADIISLLRQDSLSTMSKIAIGSYASPDGGYICNERMTFNRTNAIVNYLTDNLFVPDSLISQEYSGIDWNRLAQEVKLSDMKYKEEVLHIMKTGYVEPLNGGTPYDRWLILTDNLNKRLRTLRNGEPYRYMINNLFCKLRRSTIAATYLKTEIPAIAEDAQPVIAAAADQLAAEPELEPDTASADEAAEHTAQDEAPAALDAKVPLLALKTNLLYDILTIPTIEIEVPIGDHFSVSGEWIFPWWLFNDNANALQVLSANIDGKYWFGDRTNRPQLTGWFAGLYAGGGLYDIRYQGNGYQGEFYIASGISGGYAHTINKSGSLRMEYAIGLGYTRTKYRYYEGVENNDYLLWQRDGIYTWIGPTKAKISLVWIINKKGGKR